MEVGDKVVCVRKPKGKWHFPGGKRDLKDLGPRHTAKRESAEETGIEVDLDQVPKHVFKQRRKVRKEKSRNRTYKHLYEEYFYQIEPTPEQFEKLHACSLEEEVRLIPRDQILKMKNFKNHHRSVMKKCFPPRSA